MATRAVRPRKELKPEDMPKVNVPLRDVHNAVVFMSVAFDSKVVILGGRANSIINQREDRLTHDLDIVISNKPTVNQYGDLPTKPGSDGVYFQLDRDPSTAGRVKLVYHSPAIATVLKDTKWENKGLEIDTYYPGYVSSVNGFVPREDVNGIPISAILARSEVYSFGEGISFDVVSRPQFIIMKYQTWQTRMAANGDKHDYHDLDATIKNYYGDPESLQELVATVRKELRRYIPDKEEEIVSGILSTVSTGNFNSSIKAAARDLTA